MFNFLNLKNVKSNSKEEILMKEILLLTNKEKEVYNILMEGYTMKEVAKKLNVKFSTINFHTKSIYKKLNVHSQKELIVKFHSVFQSEEVDEI